MTPRRAVLAGLFAFGVLSACGGSSVPPAALPSERDSEGSGGAPASSPPPGYAQPDAQQQPGMSPTAPGDGTVSGGFAQPPPDALGPQLKTVDDAESAFFAAASQLANAGDDCATACKALASMERASSRICELNGPDDPEGRCSDARDRLETARKRVRGRCACMP